MISHFYLFVVASRLPVVANVSKRWESVLQRSEALSTIAGELLVPVRGCLTLDASETLAFPEEGVASDWLFYAGEDAHAPRYHSTTLGGVAYYRW